jgi:hypothetical protein
MSIENLETSLFFLTCRGSGVRIPQLPHQASKFSRLFCFLWVRGFSRNPTGSTPTACLEFFGAFFYVKNFKNPAPKINQKPVQNSEFDVLGFF